MIQRIKKFTDEVRVELAKVSWTNKEELWGSTLVVIFSVALLTLFIGFCDLLLTHAIRLLIRW